MSRFILCVVALLGLLGPAVASRPAAAPLPRPDRLPVKTAPVSTGEFVLDRDAEVLVDGRRCAYKDVPQGARVVRIEVAEDRHTILRIEFKTRN